MRTGKWRERAVACGIVAAWHCAGWWLLHAVRVAPGRGGQDALQVVYMTLPPLRAEPPHARTGSARRRSRGDRRQGPRDAALAVQSPLRAEAPEATPARAAPSAAPFAPLPDVAREAARRLIAGDPLPRSDPFASRPSRLPGSGASGHFRMAEPLTPARVVAAIGARLFYPAGYDPDPCPRNHANIASLLAAGDSPDLQRELDFERRHCRP